MRRPSGTGSDMKLAVMEEGCGHNVGNAAVWANTWAWALINIINCLGTTV